MNIMDSAGNPVDAGPARNISATAYNSASRTTTSATGDITNEYGKQIDVVVDITVNAGSLGSITVTINEKDPASGKYLPLLVSAAMTAVGTIVLRVGPGLTPAANLVAAAAVPRTLQILVTANNANPVSYSIGYNLSV